MATPPPLPPVYLSRFNVPRTLKPIPFHKIFRFEDRGTEISLQNLAQKRLDMQNSLDQSASADSTIKLIEEYLPHLHGLLHCILNQDELRTYTPLLYIWKSGLDPKKDFSSPHVFVEVGMAYATLGYLHYNSAYDLLVGVQTDMQFNEVSNRAGAHLRAAAGVFEFAGTLLQNKHPVGEYDTRPPDCVPELLTALSVLSLAHAQQIAIKKAADNVRMRKGIVAQLCADTYKKFDSAEHMLRQTSQPAAIGLVKMCNAYACLYRASAMKFMGVDAYDQEKFGVAAAYLKGAAAQAFQLEYLSGEARWMSSIIDTERAEIMRFHDIFIKENHTVYHEKEPPLDELEIPVARALITPLEFKAPVPVFQSLK